MSLRFVQNEIFIWGPVVVIRKSIFQLIRVSCLKKKRKKKQKLRFQLLVKQITQNAYLEYFIFHLITGGFYFRFLIDNLVIKMVVFGQCFHSTYCHFKNFLVNICFKDLTKISLLNLIEFILEKAFNAFINYCRIYILKRLHNLWKIKKKKIRKLLVTEYFYFPLFHGSISLAIN